MIDLLKRHKIIFPLIAAFALAGWLLAGINTARAQLNQSPLPPPNPFRFVNDNAGVIDAATKQRMETILTNLKKRADIEFAVVTVKTTGERDIFDYSMAVGRGWGIGPGNDDKNGLLLLVAVDDRKYQTLVSRHLQGDLTDSTVGEIQRRTLVAPFRAGNYGEGLLSAVQTIVATLAEKRGFSIEGIDQGSVYRPSRPPQGRTSGGISTCGVIFIIVIILIFLLASRGGGGGCLNLLFLGSLLNSGSRGSGWGGGGGFGGSSGGGGFGGFGGGGDFDGGGSGGSW